MQTREHAGFEVGTHGRTQWREASPSLRVNASKHSPTRHNRVNAPRTLSALIAIGDDIAVMNVRDFDVTRNCNQQRHQRARLPATFIKRQICCDEKCHNKQTNPARRHELRHASAAVAGCVGAPIASRQSTRCERSRAFRPSGTPSSVASTGRSDAVDASQCAQQAEMHTWRQPQFTDEKFAPSAARVLADHQNIKRDFNLVLSSPSLTEIPTFRASRFDMLWVVTMPSRQSG